MAQLEAFLVFDRTRASEELRFIPSFQGMTVFEFKEAFQQITGVSAAQLRVNGPGALERGCSFEPPTAQMSDFNASDVVVTLRQPEPLQPIRPES
mmetsp:Transcript_85400/g.169392  ORF Transcript_85400/g.169392 Transcript_85400/m.169392 type:complete len:95 (+) Transcript_85400:60-344(+)|eukprot:CAMPEP_0172718110 /NCGR_PEP_ID=MMETSP1074-20121228/73407_1 /TAXON_ID=2916 /ORGANISM="Ceratium fusus, Strain PA161109" /LENGTH=94 /DNA_ID=CAMNT_0013543201 /DNA_START=57 /DNA_END=341 /DNA_ORIENTATION=-